MQLLTTAEAAAYLRLKERKLYEMVAEGAVPCTKVTGRWLFPKAELDHWLAASVQRPAGVVRPAVGEVCETYRIRAISRLWPAAARASVAFQISGISPSRSRYRFVAASSAAGPSIRAIPAAALCFSHRVATCRRRCQRFSRATASGRGLSPGSRRSSARPRRRCRRGRGARLAVGGER